MENDILHRIEHKLDVILEHLRLKDEVVPTQPSDQRLCPVCTKEVRFITTLSFDPKSQTHANGIKRMCGCEIKPNAAYPRADI